MAANELGVAGIVWVQVAVLAEGHQGHVSETVQRFVARHPPEDPRVDDLSRERPPTLPPYNWRELARGAPRPAPAGCATSGTAPRR